MTTSAIQVPADPNAPTRSADVVSQRPRLVGHDDRLPRSLMRNESLLLDLAYSMRPDIRQVIERAADGRQLRQYRQALLGQSREALRAALRSQDPGPGHTVSQLLDHDALDRFTAVLGPSDEIAAFHVGLRSDYLSGLRDHAREQILIAVERASQAEGGIRSSHD